MNDPIYRLHDLTKELIDHLDKGLPSKIEGRDIFLDKLDQLLEWREKAIQDLHPTNTDKEKDYAKNIIKLNAEIEKKLQFIMNQIRTDIQQMSYKKKMNKKYDNLYVVQSNEGSFIDKRGI